MDTNTIFSKLIEHYNECLQYVDEKQIVGLFLQGSQNYELDYEGSDVDTKLIILPTLEDLVYNKPPISHTHVRENGEHIDFKDIRLYIQTFKKQNPNFVEILFTKYSIINPEYKDLFQILIDNNEKIAHMNYNAALKAMMGIASEKYYAMEHRYPSRVYVIDEYGYDTKQLHHLLRMEEFIERYIKGEKYADCLLPTDPLYLVSIKRNACGHAITLDIARKMADRAYTHIKSMVNENLAKNEAKIDEETEALINLVQFQIMLKCMKKMIKSA